MIRRWLSRFMMGRYGTDILSLVLLCTALVLSLVGQFSRLWIFLLLSYVPLAYAIFRTLSRQTAKRYAENQKFLSWFRGIKNWFSRKKPGVRTRTTVLLNARDAIKLCVCLREKAELQLPALSAAPRLSERYSWAGYKFSSIISFLYEQNSPGIGRGSFWIHFDKIGSIPAFRYGRYNFDQSGGV